MFQAQSASFQELQWAWLGAGARTEDEAGAAAFTRRAVVEAPWSGLDPLLSWVLQDLGPL